MAVVDRRACLVRGPRHTQAVAGELFRCDAWRRRGHARRSGRRDLHESHATNCAAGALEGAVSFPIGRGRDGAPTVKSSARMLTGSCQAKAHEENMFGPIAAL